MLRISLLGISAAIAAGLLFVNVYNSVIDATNWGAAFPDSISAARQYFSVANPGNFYRIVSPLNQVFAILAVIACWKFKLERYIAVTSLGLAVLADALTFGYFYPRNDIMFAGPIENIDNIRLAWNQWTTMNWFRSAMCAVNAALTLSILVMISKKSAQ
ncbi:MAG TPA: hypothetical protein VK589_08365 [Chryseolinea sp.]|nr:hypothetical protein [Chryseolinea sp.]